MLTKLSKTKKRVLFMCAAAMAIVLGMSGTAQAATEYVYLSDIDGRQLGYTVYLDGSNERLRVCDTQRDGYAVAARITQGNNVIATVSDGSDAGCNTKNVSLADGRYYLLKIWWKGPGGIDYSQGIVG